MVSNFILTPSYGTNDFIWPKIRKRRLIQLDHLYLFAFLYTIICKVFTRCNMSSLKLKECTQVSENQFVISSTYRSDWTASRCNSPYNVKERENDETNLIDPDRNVEQMLINNRALACADGLVLLSIVALYYLRCDSRAAHLPARPCTIMLSTARTSR